MATFGEAVAGGQATLLDGGLATQLEARGHDLSDTLWSARLLLEDPDEVRAAHADFFAAGAQVATTASYQVSASGFVAAGRSRDNAELALRRSVQLAREAASAAATDGAWVAASVGPYGAALANGSEYRGDYGLSVTELRAWHRPRLEILADAGADVLALETIPCLAEVEALLAEVDRLGVAAWLSLTVAAPALVPAAVRSSGAADSRSVDGSLDVEATTSDLEALSLPTTRFGEPIAQAYAMAADVRPRRRGRRRQLLRPGPRPRRRPRREALRSRGHRLPEQRRTLGRRRPHLDRRAHDRRRGRRHLAPRGRSAHRWLLPRRPRSHRVDAPGPLDGAALTGTGQTLST